jgi:hypothetical protein
MMEKETLETTTPTVIRRKKRMFIRKEKQYVIREKMSTRLVQKTIEGKDNVRKYALGVIGQFASYMKHKERGKLERRAIASANMGLRMFLHIIEDPRLQDQQPSASFQRIIE